MSNAISTYLKRIVLVTTSFVLALGLTTAAVPFLAAETANAATINVCNTCAHTTIQSAIDDASDNDVVTVGEGTYTENVEITKKGIILQAATERPAVIVGSILIRAAGAGSKVSGFTITTPSNNYSIALSNTSHVAIKHNIINQTTSANPSAKAIFVGDGPSSHLRIENNTISNVTSDKGAYGILINKESHVLKVHGNIISGLTGGWVTAIGLEANTPNAAVTNNTITTPEGESYTGVHFEANAGAASVNLTGNLYNGNQLSNTKSVVAVNNTAPTESASNVRFPEVLSHDSVYRYYGLNAFSTIQGGLDAVNENGTVKVSNGTHLGTAQIKKDGTKLIGQDKNSTKLYVKSNSEGGIYSTGLDDISIKELTVFAPTTGTAPTSLIKLVNGNKALIHHVDVKASQSVSTTGVNINSFSNATLQNVNVQNVGKDGVSAVSNYGGAAHTSNNLTLKGVDVTNAKWSGIAFYTNVDGATTSMQGITMRDVMVNGADRGIYFEGFNGATITGLNGSPVNVGNADLKNSLIQFINNEQSADVIATSATFNGKLGSAMTALEQNVLNSSIYDQKDLSTLGRVIFDTDKPTVSIVSPVNNGDIVRGNVTITGSTSTSTQNVKSHWVEVKGPNGYIYNDYKTTSSASWSFNWNTSGLNGEYTIRYVITDAAGNRSDDPGYANTVTRTVVVDNIAPAIVTPVQFKDGGVAEGATVAGEKIFRIEQVEINPSTIYVEVMTRNLNGDWKKDFGTEFKVSNIADFTVDTTGLSDGLHQIKITSKDKAGNHAGHSFTFIVNNAPEITSGAFVVKDDHLSLNFNANRFVDADSIKVELFDNLGQSITQNTGDSSQLLDLINGETNAEISSPFYIPFTISTDGYWQFGNPDWKTVAKPSYAVVTIYKNGMEQAVSGHISLVDDTENGYTYQALIANLPPAEDDIGTGDNDGPITLVDNDPVATPTPPTQPNFVPAGNAATDDLGEEDVQGAQTDKNENQLKNPAVLAGATGDGWNILGLMWYWWLLIIAAVGAAWWMIAAARRRGNES